MPRYLTVLSSLVCAPRSPAIADIFRMWRRFSVPPMIVVLAPGESSYLAGRSALAAVNAPIFFPVAVPTSAELR